MTQTKSSIAQAYSAFNQRNIDGALALMSDSVSEGGRVVGEDEIRTYWSRQWKEFDPHVNQSRCSTKGRQDSCTGPSTREKPWWRGAFR